MEQIERSTILSKVSYLALFRIFQPTSQISALIYRTFRDGESRAPLIPQYIQANAAVAVDVWVVDARGEVDLRRLEGVVCWEVDREEEDAAGVWRVAGSHYRRLPVELSAELR